MSLKVVIVALKADGAENKLLVPLCMSKLSMSSNNNELIHLIGDNLKKEKNNLFILL